MITDDALMAYVDGQADSETVRAIDQALASDSRLRARLDEIAARDRSVKQAFDTLLDEPVPDSLVARVRAAAEQAKIDAQRSGHPTAARNAPRWVGWAIAAQVVLLVMGVAVFQPLVRPSEPQAAYHVLGAAPQHDAANVMVMFRPEAPAHELAEVLRAVDGRIVGGPTTTDAYLVHVPAKARDAAIASLRSHKDVTMAEPMDSSGTTP